MHEESEIRLAFLLGSLTRGGAELQMIALAERLTKQGFSVDFVLRAGPGILDERAREAGASVHHIGRGSSAETPTVTRLARRLGTNVRWVRTARSERFDIVDAWLHPADVLAALTRPLVRAPVVMSARLGRSPRVRFGPGTPLLESTVHRLIDVVVANSEITASDVVRDQGVPASRVRIIRGGVRLPRVFTAAERRTQRAALGAGDEHLLIGSVGNFRSMKRQDLLIDAFAQLLAERGDLRLALVGDGDLRAQIERQVERLGLRERVVLYGTATDLPPIYDAFDLFVQASNSEGLPNVLLEASASALAIVATAAGGSGEVVRDGETGLLVPIDDFDALVVAMRTAVDDADLRRRLGAAARDLVDHDYGMERFFREYADLYRERFELASK